MNDSAVHSFLPPRLWALHDRSPLVRDVVASARERGQGIESTLEDIALALAQHVPDLDVAVTEDA